MRASQKTAACGVAASIARLRRTSVRLIARYLRALQVAFFA